MRVNDFRHRFGRHVSATDLKERTHHCANHITQEPIGGDDEICLGLVLSYPLCFAHIADGGLYICVDAAERSEVLFAEQQRCGLVHRLEIQPRCHARVGDIEERVFAGRDTIAVRARRGSKPRMGIVAYQLNSLNGDGRRQEVIEPCTKICRYRFLDIKMRYHLLCMYAGVGAPGKRQR